VPIHVSGTRGGGCHGGHRWMVFKAGRPGPRHPVEIRFGGTRSSRATANGFSEVMERVRLFLAECGAGTERRRAVERARPHQPA